MIPDWDMSGVLPPIMPEREGHDPDRSPYCTCLSNFIEHFAVSPERIGIMQGLLNYRKKLAQYGISSGFQWLDGSFTENIEVLEERSPNDIDVVTFFEMPDGTKQNEYISISSEMKELQALLAEIPQENVIERVGFESRLEDAHQRIAGITTYQINHKAFLTFRGELVFGSKGIAADFASKAVGAFTDAVAAVAAGLSENLMYMGRIPDKQKNQLLITGTAVGSFGFEFEVPLPDEADNDWFPDCTPAELALDKVQRLLYLSAKGSDDDVAELVSEIHPRGVKKVADFMDFIAQQNAWCGIQFKDQKFRFEGRNHVKESADRLKEENIHQATKSFKGEFQGVLPKSRTFEFRCDTDSIVLRGRVGNEIENADLINRDFLHKPVTVKLFEIQVGQGRPRYTLEKMDDVDVINLT